MACTRGSRILQIHPTRRCNLRCLHCYSLSGPEEGGDHKAIASPVYGFYGGNDARVNATIPKSADFMKQAGKTYEPVTYDGAGHGFMRAGEAPDAGEANRKAREAAWKRWKELLGRL